MTKQVVLKRMLAIPVTDGPHETPELIDSGVPFMSAESVKNGYLDFSLRRGNISKELHALYSKKAKPQRDDVFMVKSGATTGKVAIVETDEEFSIWSPLALLRSNKKLLDPRYLYYVLKSDYFQEQVQNSWSFGTQQNIGMQVIENLSIPEIGIKYQKKAVRYLDGKTSIVDKMIIAENHTHTHLSELRQAIITNAVLGRGGDVMNLQQTNIPWIGEIPAHWTVKKIKHVATVKARIGWQALTTDEYIDAGPYLVTGTDFRDGTIDWSSAAHVSDQRWAIDSNIQLEEDDLLLTKDGTIGKVAMVKDLKGRATLNSGVFVIRAARDRYNPRYLYHVLNSGIFTGFIDYNKAGSTIVHLYQKTFVEFAFPMPPLDEQDEIVKHLDVSLGQADIAITKVKDSIGLLEEYRSSLISNVVGGKVEV